MLNAPLFFKTESARRAYQVLRSYSRIAKQFNKITVELEQLNALMKTMPAVLAEDNPDLPEPEQWNEAIQFYGNATDDLSCSMFDNAQLMTELSKALEFFNKYDDEL